MTALPTIRSHERMTYKRCKKKWYWSWRLGLVLKTKQFDALEFGTWVHEALARWYAYPGTRRNGALAEHFSIVAHASIEIAKRQGAPEWMIDKAYEMLSLGEAMLEAYAQKYGKDSGVHVIQAELPLGFTFPGAFGKPQAIHRFKPDLVYADSQGRVWLMEHKTAASIRVGHLPIDDQARPYGAMAERALRNLGMIDHETPFAGIMYNFLRKALPDERETNKDGKYLNKNGTVSKRQPPPLFLRHPVKLTRKAKMITLERVQKETIEITDLTRSLRSGETRAEDLQKTPHYSCERTCSFFDLCVAEEEGSPIRTMRDAMFIRKDPYTYGESTEEPVGFEMG